MISTPDFIPPQLPEVEPFPVLEGASHLQPGEDDPTYARTARGEVARLAGEAAARHGAIVDTDAVRTITSELVTNATREGRHLRDIALEWRNSLDGTPMQVPSDRLGDTKVSGYAVVRVSDDLPGFVKDPRPDHDFNEAETQQTPLVPQDSADIEQQAAQDDFSETWDLDSLMEPTGNQAEAEVDTETPDPKDGQSNRGLDLVNKLSAASVHYKERGIGKTVVAVLPAFPDTHTDQAA